MGTGVGKRRPYSARCEDRESGGVQLGRGGRDGRCGWVGRAAVPIGDDAAGAADDGDEGGDIPGVHDRIEGKVGPAAGDKQVAVAVSPSADEFGRGEQAVGGGAVLVFGEIERVAREQRSIGEARGGPAADGAAVEGGGRAVAEHELAQNGLVNAAEHGLALVEEGDECAPKRDAGDERLGAVDGIEHPDELGVGVLGAKFFADDAVGGEFCGNEPAQEFFGAAIGGRDRGGIGFGFDGEGGIREVWADKVAAALGEFGRESAVGREIHAARVARESHE